MDDRFMIGFEKATQELLKETWELLICGFGSLTFLSLVGYGIYFSAIALAAIFGKTREMMIFCYCMAFSISALEVSAIKVFGNKARAEVIKMVSSKEYWIVGIGTIFLFSFDLITNWIGLYIFAKTLLMGGEEISWGNLSVILMVGIVMAFSELGVGFLLRATGTAFAGYIQAKKKYDAYIKSPTLSAIGNVSQSPSSQSSYSRPHPQPLMKDDSAPKSQWNVFPDDGKPKSQNNQMSQSEKEQRFGRREK